jgi:signal transduction histidine kinase
MTANEIAQLTARQRDVRAMGLTLCFLPFGLYVVFFIRHAPAGGAIWVSSHVRDPQCISLWVTDEGPGIPKGLQERIFERYVHAQREETHKAGMGLGLFIVKRIAEMHGGEVMCESEPGEGATFRVILRSV